MNYIRNAKSKLMVVGMINETLLKIIIDGLIRGGSYSLIALGLTLLYGVARIVNMSHGSLFMLSVYIYYAFSTPLILGLNPWLALIMAILFMGVFGAIMHRLAVHPILGDDVAIMVVTITIAVAIQALVIMFFGGETIGLISPIESSYFEFLGVTVSWLSVMTLILSLSLFALIALFISKTKIGKAMQALSQDREAAMLMGINTNRLYILTMILSVILASIAGFIYCIPYRMVYPGVWLNAIISAFAIVIVGGLGSIKGSLIGSFVIGYAEIIVRELHTEGGAIVPLAPLSVMIAVLIIRPKGLFGKRVEMED
jgi:branched-chain amino acid transport system permease protein